jgi:hypothetical protein
MTTNQRPIPPRPRNVNDRRANGMPIADLPKISAAEADAEPAGGRLFDPPAPAPEAPAESPTLATIHDKLCKPFPLAVVEIKPGAVTKDRAKALAMAYVDPRAYQTRLDRLAGPEGWSVRYTPTGDGRSIICSLTILGVTKEDVGECSAGDENQATSAAMQAFKRACAAFGMGRYLYSLPQPWVAYDESRKSIADPQATAHRIYELAGLLPK